MKNASKQSSLQYQLRIATVLNERTGKNNVRFLLETAQSFANFVYDLTVKEELKGNQIHLKIEGLKPPKLSIPAAGHAKFEREYENLHGSYEIVLEGLDGKSTTFSLRVAGKKLEVTQAQRNAFVEIILDTL